MPGASARTFSPGITLRIGLLTLETLHYGMAAEVHVARAAVLQAASAAHSERFVRKIPVPQALPEAAWINQPKPLEQRDEARHEIRTHGVSKSLTHSARLSLIAWRNH